jgi:hypothetical protein
MNDQLTTSWSGQKGFRHTLTTTQRDHETPLDVEKRHLASLGMLTNSRLEQVDDSELLAKLKAAALKIVEAQTHPGSFSLAGEGVPVEDAPTVVPSAAPSPDSITPPPA